jgi:hypothetical protein
MRRTGFAFEPLSRFGAVGSWVGIGLALGRQTASVPCAAVKS